MTTNQDFTPEQKRYLEGFVSGAQTARAGRGLKFAELAAAGTLTRLSTAFSRDQEQKVYVQDRMIEEGEELFRWLCDDAWFYVCGDAKRMTGDVDRALHRVVAVHGGMYETGARGYVADLIKSGRYLRDIY